MVHSTIFVSRGGSSFQGRVNHIDKVARDDRVWMGGGHQFGVPWQRHWRCRYVLVADLQPNKCPRAWFPVLASARGAVWQPRCFLPRTCHLLCNDQQSACVLTRTHFPSHVPVPRRPDRCRRGRLQLGDVHPRRPLPRGGVPHTRLLFPNRMPLCF